jgi:predicted nucleotidyltransferase component of viral defense system
LPDGRVIQAYSRAETATEKVLALADRARNEPRDLYELWHLVTCEGINLAELVPAMAAKLAFRERETLGNRSGDHQEGATVEGTVVHALRQ